MANFHEIDPTPDRVHWGYFASDIAPTIQIASGDIVTVHTLSGEPHDMPPPDGGYTILPHHLEVHSATKRGPGPHLMTGPIGVTGAEPGDSLAIEILDTRLRQDWGFIVILTKYGTLTEDFHREYRRIVAIDRARRVIHMPWGLQLAARPFFGVIGTAPPPEMGQCNSIVPGAFGGNIDNKEMQPGVTLHLPVFVHGGLVSFGDGHGAQGDGEVCSTAIETAVSGTVRIELEKRTRIERPWAENSTHLMTMSFEEDLNEAVKVALRDLIKLIGQKSGLSPEDAYLLCSVAADIRITQVVNLRKGVHAMIPKWALEPPR